MMAMAMGWMGLDAYGRYGYGYGYTDGRVHVAKPKSKNKYTTHSTQYVRTVFDHSFVHYRSFTQMAFSPQP